MKQFNREEVLNDIVNAFEKSKSNRGYVLIKTSLFKEYSNELNHKYIIDFNELCLELEEQKVIEITYNKVNSKIITSIKAMNSGIDYIYHSIGRHTRKDKVIKLRSLLETYLDKNSSILNELIVYLQDRIDLGKPIKKYVDIDNLDEFEKVLISINKMEQLKHETLKRKFSARYLNDSKVFEVIEKKICRIIRDFTPDYDYLSDTDLLSRFNLVSYPSQIVIKGICKIQYDSTELDISKLGVIHLESDFVDGVKSVECRKIITIENKATFYEYVPKNELVVYTGGFPNQLTIQFLNVTLKNYDPNDFYHFSDIDLGGFLILKYLRESVDTNINSYKMSKDVLLEYNDYCKNINKKTSLEKLGKITEDNVFTKAEIECIRYILDNKITLEQENIRLN